MTVLSPAELAERCQRAYVDPAKVDDLGYLLARFGEWYAAAAIDQGDESEDRCSAASDLICDLVDRLEEQGSQLTRELDLRSRGQVSDNARNLLAEHDWDELIFGGFICLACTPGDADDPDDNVGWPCKPLLEAGITLLHAEAIIKLHRAEVELKAARSKLAALEAAATTDPEPTPATGTSRTAITGVGER